MSLWGNIVFKEGREGNDGNSVDKRETEVLYFGSGRILFGYTIRSNEGAHGSVFFSSSAHSQALYIVRTILRTLLFARPQCFF